MTTVKDVRLAFDKYLRLLNETYQLVDLAMLNARLACEAAEDAAAWWLETERIRLQMLEVLDELET